MITKRALRRENEALEAEKASLIREREALRGEVKTAKFNLRRKINEVNQLRDALERAPVPVDADEAIEYAAHTAADLRAVQEPGAGACPRCLLLTDRLADLQAANEGAYRAAYDATGDPAFAVDGTLPAAAPAPDTTQPEGDK